MSVLDAAGWIQAYVGIVVPCSVLQIVADFRNEKQLCIIKTGNRDMLSMTHAGLSADKGGDAELDVVQSVRLYAKVSLAASSSASSHGSRLTCIRDAVLTRR